jgi:hypothetical protein
MRYLVLRSGFSSLRRRWPTFEKASAHAAQLLLNKDAAAKVAIIDLASGAVYNESEIAKLTPPPCY